MRKSDLKVPEGSAEFDPDIGLALADTWWQLGKKIALVLNSDGQSQKRALEQWTDEVRDQLKEDAMNEPLGGVTPEAVMAFITTVMDVLERKYDGKNIARDVRRLTKKANDFNVYDDGQYLDLQEPAEVFWAVEYDFLFSRMDKAMHARGWLNAVARCADPECNKFFIKARIDNRYHTSGCSMRARQRQAYKERKGSGTHSKRGRPRLRR